MRELIFATNNPNKVSEVRVILPPGFEVKSLKEADILVDVPEDQDNLKDNALQKANFIKQHFGYDCFSEDTGLEVDALNGAPGVHTARYAGPQRNEEDNMQKVLDQLRGEAERTARFHTVIALILGDQVHTFEGICEGRIALEKNGTGGFGYDPIFIPDGFTDTFAALSPKVKNKISHRVRAMEQLIAFLRSEPMD